MEITRLMLIRRVLMSRPNIVFVKRSITTSSKNKDTATIAETVLKKKPKVIADSHVAKDDWISYGFNYQSEHLDRFIMKVLMFMSITVVMVGGAFIFAYQPDLRARDWSRREAFLELHRREKLGLPLVDPDLVDPSRIVLPSDEELGETEIII